MLFAMIIVSVVFGGWAMAAEIIACSDGFCTMRIDTLREIVNHIQRLESLIGKTCI